MPECTSFADRNTSSSKVEDNLEKRTSEEILKQICFERFSEVKQATLPSMALDRRGLTEPVEKARSIDFGNDVADIAHVDTLNRKLYREADLLYSGISNGASRRMQEMIQDPLGSAGALGACALIGASLNLSSRMGGRWASAGNIGAYGVKLVLGADVLRRGVPTGAAVIDTWSSSNNLDLNKNVVGKYAGSALVDYPAMILAGSMGSYATSKFSIKSAEPTVAKPNQIDYTSRNNPKSPAFDPEFARAVDRILAVDAARAQFEQAHPKSSESSTDPTRADEHKSSEFEDGVKEAIKRILATDAARAKFEQAHSMPKIASAESGQLMGKPSVQSSSRILTTVVPFDLSYPKHK